MCLAQYAYKRLQFLNLQVPFFCSCYPLFLSSQLNKASSRAHSILTFNIESRENEHAPVVLGKLHLVDLAGSERLSRSGGVYAHTHAHALVHLHHAHSRTHFSMQARTYAHAHARSRSHSFLHARTSTFYHSHAHAFSIHAPTRILTLAHANARI